MAKVTPTRSRGYAFIPESRLDLLTKVVKRLQKDGIDFEMEEVNEPRPYGLKRSWNYGKTERESRQAQMSAGPYDYAPSCPPFATVSGTLITWPASENL